MSYERSPWLDDLLIDQRKQARLGVVHGPYGSAQRLTATQPAVASGVTDIEDIPEAEDRFASTRRQVAWVRRR